MDLADRSSPSLVHLDKYLTLYSIRRQGDVRYLCFFFFPVAAAKESSEYLFIKPTVYWSILYF